MKKKIELMAPAGSYEALEAAVNAGADAVYLGGSHFGARKYANNFAHDELKKAVEFAHLRKVRIYVTVNILVADSELQAAADYLVFLYNIGVDAIIVQDLGICKLAKEVVPDLPLFASTQLTVTDSQSTKLAQSLGFARVVLPREASLSDIKKITTDTDCEMEVFVHGALCMCYSGQCLMSSLIGARSGNRGQCAQPCRLPYVLVDEQGSEVVEQGQAGKYLLSPKDLNAIELLPELIEAGVTSFKIEGRMKRPEYVAIVTRAYRQALDKYLMGQYVIDEKTHRELRQIFNRDFTTGYFLGKPGRAILSDKRPNNRGVQVGRLVAAEKQKGYIEIKLEENICAGDELDIWVRVGGRAGLKVQDMTSKGKPVQKAVKGEVVRLPFKQSASVNDRVFRTFDFALTQEARKLFGQDSQSTIGVQASVVAVEGQALAITFDDGQGNIGSGQSDFIAEQARKHALTEETLLKQVERLGGSDFHLTNFSARLDANIMVPVSEINKARRDALEALRQARLDSFLYREAISETKIAISGKEKAVAKNNPLLAVHVDTLEKLKASLEAGADLIIYGGDTYDHHAITENEYKSAFTLCQQHGKGLYFGTPRIIMQNEQEAFARQIDTFRQFAVSGIVVSSLSAFESLHGQDLPLWIDYSLNSFNSFALSLWREQGVQGVTLSQELNFGQIAELSGKLPLECVVHGHTEMMVTQYCAVGGLLGKQENGGCQAPCKNNRYYLKDRMGEHFPLVTDQYSRMHVLNAKELCLIDHLDKFAALGIERLRIDGRSYKAQQLGSIVKAYRNVLDGRANLDIGADITKGHYFRGVI